MTDFFVAFQSWLVQWRWPLAVCAALLMADQLRRVRAGDRALALSLFAQFFAIIIAFWILKPVKKALLVAHYARDPLALWGHSLQPAQVEMLAKQANVLVALAVALVAGLVARHVRREAYLLSFVLAMAALLLALIPHLETASSWAVWLFYLYGDLFVSALVASLFSLVADSFDPAGAHAAYAFVGLGGVMGGFAGSALAGAVPVLAQPAGAAFGALALCLAIAAGGLLSGYLLRNRPLLSFRSTLRRPTGGGVAAALELLARSPYLRLILALVMLYEMVSVCMDYQFTATVTRLLEPAQYRAHFAGVFAFTNFAALAVQLLLTGWILRRWGAGPALLLMPVVAIGGSLAFLASPVLLWASLLNTADNALAYSVQQTAKEFMYVPTAREEKYEAKGFIDVFGLRLAKGLAILLGAGISLVLGGDALRWISVPVIALLAAWLLAAWRLRDLHGLMLQSLSRRSSRPLPGS